MPQSQTLDLQSRVVAFSARGLGGSDPNSSRAE